MTDPSLQSASRFKILRPRSGRGRVVPRLSRIGCAVVFTLGLGCAQGESVLDPVQRALSRDAVGRAQGRLDAGDLAGALGHYERAVRFDDRNSEAHAGMGNILLKQGYEERAIEHLAAAVRHAPNNAEHAVQLGDHLVRLSATSMNRGELLEAARRAYEHAASIDPHDADTLQRLAACQYRLGREDEAVNLLKKAATVDSDSADIHVQLGRIYDARFDYEPALEEFGIAIRIDPDSAAAHHGCGVVNMTLAETHSGNPIYRARATAHLRRTLELDPNQPDVVAMLRTSAPPQLRTVTAAGESDR